MTQRIRIITYIIIIAIVLLLTWWGIPKRHFTPRGLYLPTTKQTFAPILAQQVTFSGPEQTITGKKIGMINIEAYAPKSMKAVAKAIEQYAANLAVKQGANHIVIYAFGPEGKVLHFQGYAFRS